MSAIDDLRAKHQTCIQYKNKLQALPFICKLNEILNIHTTPKQACLFLTHKTQDTPCPHLPLQLFSWLCCVSFLGNLQVIRRSSKFQTIRLEKWRKRKQHIHCEKPLGNVMFVFNPFFSHCSHCLTSIEWVQGKEVVSPLPTLDWAWQLPAKHSTAVPCALLVIPLAWPAPRHSTLHFCCVRFAFILCLFFCFFFYRIAA